MYISILLQCKIFFFFFNFIMFLIYKNEKIRKNLEVLKKNHLISVSKKWYTK